MKKSDTDIKLLISNSLKVTSLRVAKEVVAQPNLIPQFIELAFSETPCYSMRAANIIQLCDEENQVLIKPYLHTIISALPTFKIEGVKRCFLKLCINKDFSKDEELHTILLNTCFNWVNSNSEAIAVRYYSVKILYNISQYIPDIKPELIASLEFIQPENGAALNSVAREYLKKLRRKPKK